MYNDILHIQRIRRFLRKDKLKIWTVGGYLTESDEYEPGGKTRTITVYGSPHDMDRLAEHLRKLKDYEETRRNPVTGLGTTEIIYK